MIRSKKLRDSARGQVCTLNIARICNGNPETTILAHIPDGNGGMALKGHDISACFACSSCHDAIDGRHPYFQQGNNRDHYHWYLMRGLNRTLVAWIESGLINVKGYKAGGAK
jgi:hypothetical protein